MGHSKEHKKALKKMTNHHKAKLAKMNGADAKGFNYLLIYVDKDDKYKPKKNDKKKDDKKKVDKKKPGAKKTPVKKAPAKKAPAKKSCCQEGPSKKSSS